MLGNAKTELPPLLWPAEWKRPAPLGPYFLTFPTSLFFHTVYIWLWTSMLCKFLRTPSHANHERETHRIGLFFQPEWCSVCRHPNVHMTHIVIMSTWHILSFHRFIKKSRTSVHSLFHSISMSNWYRDFEICSCINCTSSPGWCWPATAARQPHPGPGRWIG